MAQHQNAHASVSDAGTGLTRLQVVRVCFGNFNTRPSPLATRNSQLAPDYPISLSITCPPN